MITESSQRKKEIIVEEAAEWIVELQSADEKTRRVFADWLRASPQHVREFLAMASLWDALAELPEKQSLEQLVEEALAESNVVSLDAASRARPAATKNKPASARRWMALAASIAMAALVAVTLSSRLPFIHDPDLYVTEIGEQRRVSLPDGSFVDLNTQSRLRVSYSDEFRDLRLLEGEAMFDVAKDPARPFRVFTEKAIIQAIGTQFNVYDVGDEITVTVVEGVVSITQTLDDPDTTPEGGAAAAELFEPVEVSVGYQARLGQNVGKVKLVAMEVEKAIAWQNRRLIFDNWSLQSVINEFNRYNDPPLLIDDAELESLPISGVFAADDRGSFVQYLGQMQLAQATTRRDGTIVLTKPAAD